MITDQDLLSGFVLALYLFAQVSVGDLQILSHLAVVVEEGQVAILDPNQLQEEVRSDFERLKLTCYSHSK